jgi:hypothetical protein
MTEHLNAWWQDVESAANQIQRIIIGDDAENPTMLSACEWADVFVDQQRQIRVGVQRNSYWHLDVAQEGDYEFLLRRWPEESGLGLLDVCERTTLTDGELPGGNVLPIAQARLMIDGVSHVKPVDKTDDGVTFALHLGPGPVLLHTWFDDEELQPICGAYYVYVRRL